MRAAPPNIVLINCDDLGYGDLGCYGSEVNSTPAIDSLARDGLRFTDFYMASPVCSPSRGGMLTGCYPPRIGFGLFGGPHGWVLMPGQPFGLNPEETTFARLLQQQGYATQIVGKWHCGDQPEFLPTRHGFDSHYGLPYSNDMGRQAAQPRMDLPPLPLLRNEEVVEQQPDQASLTSRYVEESVRFLRENRDRPFLLYFAHMYVHVPLYVPERFARESRNGRYGAAVACIDWATGMILHELQELGLEENTLVVFTSDNGSRARGEGGSNGPLRGTKFTTWEGGQRVPCLMRWPGRIPAGTVCRELALSLDFYPTFAELAGAEMPRDRIIDGRSLLPQMLSGGQEPSAHEDFFYYLGDTLEAVRDHTWKLHVRKSGEELRELYNLAEDPGETHNVYDEHPEVVAELTARLEACRRDLGDLARGLPGENRRPCGCVQHPRPLTVYDPDYPYYMAEYDLEQRG